jgi:hypothetical protein
MRHLIIPAAVCLGFAGGAYGDPVDAEADQITRLIKQLGDKVFAKRNAATKELEAIGEKALPALRNAAAANADLEIRRRAQHLVTRITHWLPQLGYAGKEESGNFTRYKLTVTNRDNYPEHWFKPSPDLPPIGLNTQASRTLIEIYTASNERLYGFATIRSGADLDRLWFAVRKGVQAPAQVYIVVHDRQLNRFYKSNLVTIGRGID